MWDIGEILILTRHGVCTDTYRVMASNVTRKGRILPCSQMPAIQPIQSISKLRLIPSSGTYDCLIYLQIMKQITTRITNLNPPYINV